MLVLTRKKDQTIMIGEKIEITILEVKGDQIRIGINAPKDVTILRKEIYQEILAENTVAIANDNINLANISQILRKSTK